MKLRMGTGISMLAIALMACGAGSEDDVGAGTGAFAEGSSPEKGTPKGNAPEEKPKASLQGALTRCEADEDTLFQCTTKTGGGDKVIAICASKDASATKGYVQYRFGTAAKREISLPADQDREQFRRIAKGANTPLAGGGGAHIRFMAGDAKKTSYVVYTALVRTGEGPEDRAGFFVEQEDEQGMKRIATLDCTSPEEAASSSQVGLDLFEKLNLPADASLELEL